jgi:fructose 1,6-bisphosphate aldolase/phosphatase
MKITISVIKADIGSIGGHICPSQRLLETVRSHVESQGQNLTLDRYASFTGDDIAIVMTHTKGVGNERGRESFIYNRLNPNLPPQNPLLSV